jgi:hypothetical protein
VGYSNFPSEEDSLQKQEKTFPRENASFHFFADEVEV